MTDQPTSNRGIGHAKRVALRGFRNEGQVGPKYMDEATICEFLKAYRDPKETVKKLEAQLTKAEKEIYALQEALAALRQHISGLEESIKDLGG